MFCSRAILLLASLCLLASGRPTLYARSSSALVLKSTVTLPSGFKDLGKAPAHSTIALKIYLTEPNSDQLSAALAAVSDPKSPSYGKFMSEAQIDALTAPPQANIDAVQSWLKSNALTGTFNGAGDEIDVTTTVQQANRLLGAHYHTYTNTANGVQSVNTLKYSLPSNLNGIVDFVSPTTEFPQLVALARLRAAWASPSPSRSAASAAAASAAAPPSAAPSAWAASTAAPSAPPA